MYTGASLLSAGTEALPEHRLDAALDVPFLAVEGPGLQHQGDGIVGRERLSPGGEQRLPALALGEVEVRQEHEPAGSTSSGYGSTPGENRSKSIVPPTIRIFRSGMPLSANASKL